MGINKADFIEGLKAALCDSQVVEALKAAVTEPLQKEINELKGIIVQKDKQLTDLETQLKDLQHKCDSNEQYSRRNNLRIYGLRENPDENLTETVTSLLNKELELQPPLTHADIDRVHRIGPNKPGNQQQPRQCILKLTTYQARARIYKARTKLRRSQTRLFINEDLTKIRADLLWAIRDLKRKEKLQDGWSHDGKVTVKLSDGKIKQIKDKEHLSSLIN